MAGAEGLEPSARGFGVTTDSLNMYLPLKMTFIIISVQAVFAAYLRITVCIYEL